MTLYREQERVHTARFSAGSGSHVSVYFFFVSDGLFFFLTIFI